MPPFLEQILAPERWPTFVLITARISGMMIAAPLWSMSLMPVRVRGAITVVLALLLSTTVPPTTLPVAALDLPLPVVMELLIGTVIGLTAAVLVHGVTVGGEVVSIQMGLSLGPTLAPNTEFDVPSIAQLKTALALLIFTATGGHLVLLQGLAESLRRLPPGAPIALEGGFEGARLFGTMFWSAIHTAAPVMVTLLATNTALALLSRAVPQLNAMMVSLPLSIGVGLVMVGASLQFVGAVFGGWMDALPSAIAEVLISLQPSTGP